MSERDLFFLVLTTIIAGSLIAVVVQVIRSRRGGRDRGNWWEGPGDDDPPR